MLNDADASGFKKVYLAMGFTDLRRGIDGLATIVRFQFKLDPYDKNTLFLFCGRRCDRIKALLWEGDGFLLMYKRLDNGAFRWPRSADEAMAITDDQDRMLILDSLSKHSKNANFSIPLAIAKLLKAQEKSAGEFDEAVSLLNGISKMPKIKKYQNCKNDVYQPDEKGYPQTVFSHSICYRVNRKTVVDNTSEKL